MFTKMISMKKPEEKPMVPKSYNVRVEGDLVRWLENVKIGNASTVIRAAIWLLSLQDDAMDIAKTYERRQTDKAIPPDFRKRASQVSGKGKKKPRG
jgi:hypothetical protein